MKPAKFDELDRVLYEWFKQRRSEGIPISGFILREKAREFHQTMDLEELLLYYIIIIIIFGGKFDYPVNSIIRTGAGPVESGLPSFYCIIKHIKLIYSQLPLNYCIYYSQCYILNFCSPMIVATKRCVLCLLHQHC